jgi:hypothetical protein
MIITAVVAQGIAGPVQSVAITTLPMVRPDSRRWWAALIVSGVKTCEPGRCNRPDSSFSDEGSNSFESSSLALNVVPVENLAEDHLRM